LALLALCGHVNKTIISANRQLIANSNDNLFGILCYSTPNTETHSHTKFMEANGESAIVINILSKLPIYPSKIIPILESKQSKCESHPLHYMIYSIMGTGEDIPPFVRRYNDFRKNFEDFNQDHSKLTKNLILLGINLVEIYTGYHPHSQFWGTNQFLLSLSKRISNSIEQHHIDEADTLKLDLRK